MKPSTLLTLAFAALEALRHHRDRQREPEPRAERSASATRAVLLAKRTLAVEGSLERAVLRHVLVGGVDAK